MYAGGAEEVDQVRAVEAYYQGVVVVGGFDDVFGLASVGGLGGEFELVLFEADLDGSGALVGELGYTLDAGHEVFRADDDELGVVAGEDGFVVGELAGELAAGEDAAAYFEEEGLVVVSELERGGVGGGEQAGELGEGLAGDQGLLFAGDAVEGLAQGFDVGEAVTIGGDHGHGLGLEDQEGAVEGVAGLFVGDGEDGLRDHVGQRRGGDFVGSGGGELGDLGEVGAGHADHLGVGATRPDLDPVVVHEFERDVAVAEELDVVVELAGGDGAGSGLFHLRRAGGAEGLVEVGGGDGELACS